MSSSTGEAGADLWEEASLGAAGFRAQAENTDTTFGIVIKSHYTICTESEPHGDVVTVLAQKYGC